MKVFQNAKSERVLTCLADISLFVCLFAEAAYGHTRFSQLSLIVFFFCTMMLAIQKRRLSLSWWMICFLLFIVWSAVVSFGWAIDRSVSLQMVQTLIVTFAYCFFLYQYLLLRANLKRYLGIYVITTLMFVIVMLLRERAVDLTTTRLGYVAGVHPNRIGLLSACAFGASIILVGKREKLLWLLPMPAFLFAIAVTMSVSSAAAAGVLMIALLLVRFPKRWGLKLGVLILAGAAAFYLVIMTENPLSLGVLHRVREVALFFLKGEGSGGSTIERSSLIVAAWNWFLQRPFTGWGHGCYRFLDGSLGKYSHSNYLELLVAGGIPMALIFYVGQVGAVVYAIKTLKRTKAASIDGGRKDLRQLVIVFTVFLIQRILFDAINVTYYDRSQVSYCILLFAAARLLAAPEAPESNLEIKDSSEARVS